ncbi:MAG: lysophospholipid acyltransferase family protein [Candidatus Stahlbacteria bacterium]|nr:lysophospholipid acyltransferase family protein [Candidatus Stahlbacteria bacterium]
MILFYRVVAFLSCIVNRRLALFVTDQIGKLMYFTLYRKRVRKVISNLKHIDKKLTSLEAQKTVLTIYRNFACFIYEFLLLPRLSSRNLFDYIDIEHKEYLDTAMKGGKGVIALTAHLGNWEIGGAILGILGYSPTVISLSQPSQGMKDFFTNRRESVGVKVAYIEERLTNVISTLRRGGIVATLGDRVYSGQHYEGKLFGANYCFPSGPFKLHHRLGCPIVPTFCVREGTKYKLYIEPELKNGIIEWSQILEKYIPRYVTQWYVFEQLWGKNSKLKSQNSKV